MKKIYAPLFLMIIFAACVKPVELDIPEFEPTPVVNCFFNVNEPFNVHISKTKSKFDTLMCNVENAWVGIYTHDTLLINLEHTEQGWYTMEGILPKVGVLYTLKVEIPDFKTITATDSIPSTFSEFSFTSYQKSAWFDEDGRGCGVMMFEIDDKPGSNFFEVQYIARQEYYREELDSVVTTYRFDALQCIDPFVIEDQIRRVFSDRFFDGQKYNLKLMGFNLDYYVSKDFTEFIINVTQGSTSFYKYRLTYYKHRESQYADFWNPIEPVIMYSNIENGYGVFAGYHTKSYSISIEQ